MPACYPQGMPTNRKSETARANGALSTGPVTPAGKARSSQNALKHGLHSKQILLPTESAEEFHTLRDSYFDQFQPATPVEAELVESLAATRWRIRRLATIEANMFRNNILEKEKYIPEELDDAGEEARLAWSFKNIANNGSALQVLLRYEATLSRTYDRAFKQLQLLQTQRPAGQDGKQQNEPTEPQPSSLGVVRHALDGSTFAIEKQDLCSESPVHAAIGDCDAVRARVDALQFEAQRGLPCEGGGPIGTNRGLAT
jgi:hypothetical protein